MTEEIYNQIIEVSRLQNSDLSLEVCKLTEETGELAQAVNRTLGIKNHDMSDGEVRDAVGEEIIDTIQNALSIARHYNYSYAELNKLFVLKNNEWLKKINKRKTQ
jgi:NTP pyrophosphatase (non-canonical NTP hydrolase)